MLKLKYKYQNYWDNEIEYKIPEVSDLKKHYSNWEKNLTKKENRAVSSYKRSSYIKNMIIRKLNVIPLSIYFLSDALEKSSLSENIVVNRAIRKGELKEIETRYRNQEHFFKKDFCSTYTGPFIYRFNRRANLIILLPKGSKAAYLDGKKRLYGYEKEILIQRNSEFSIISKISKLGRTIYILKLINAKTETR